MNNIIDLAPKPTTLFQPPEVILKIQEELALKSVENLRKTIHNVLLNMYVEGQPVIVDLAGINSAAIIEISKELHEAGWYCDASKEKDDDGNTKLRLTINAKETK
jgi:hypothetical protein